MGLIRGSLLVIACVLLLMSLLAFNSLWMLSDSLEYENIQNKLVPVVTELIEGQIDFSSEIEGMASDIEIYCENNSEFVFSQEGYVIDIPCSVASEGSDAIIEEGISDIVNQIYYEEYNCGFWDCFEEDTRPFFLVSEKAHDYWTGKFYLVLLVLIALLLIIFFLAENKSNAFIISGSLIILSSLPLVKIESFLKLFMDEFVQNILGVFFSKSHAVFVCMLVIGIIFLAFGIILKFFKIGFKISEFFSRFGKKKEESVKSSEPKKSK